MLQLPIVSAWDPRATSSGSIDPLGALRAYSSIAGFLLPGVTTVTTRVRYLSWLCAGLRLLDEMPDAPNGGQAGRARRQRLLAWERLVVLATGHYAVDSNLTSDHLAWNRLRGVSYVRRAIAERRKSVNFELLTNQASVGGVGTYWVTMVNGGLVEDVSATLTHRGVTLADEFLKQRHMPSREKLRRIFSGQYPEFKPDDLAAWGQNICLDVSAASNSERRALCDALLEPGSHRRLALALKQEKHARSDRPAFVRLEKRLRTQHDTSALQLASVVATAEAFESVHAGLLDHFDRLCAASANGGNVPMDRAAAICGAVTGLADRGAALQKVLDDNPQLPRPVATVMRQFLGAVRRSLDAATPGDLVIELCRHHERVQSGKFDASRQPKQPWVALKNRDVFISPRFARDALPEAQAVDAFTHPYRLESFAGMLTEVGGWEGVA